MEKSSGLKATIEAMENAIGSVQVENAKQDASSMDRVAPSHVVGWEEIVEIVRVKEGGLLRLKYQHPYCLYVIGQQSS